MRLNGEVWKTLSPLLKPFSFLNLSLLLKPFSVCFWNLFLFFETFLCFKTFLCFWNLSLFLKPFSDFETFLCFWNLYGDLKSLWTFEIIMEIWNLFGHFFKHLIVMFTNRDHTCKQNIWPIALYHTTFQFNVHVFPDVFTNFQGPSQQNSYHFLQGSQQVVSVQRPIWFVLWVNRWIHCRKEASRTIQIWMFMFVCLLFISWQYSSSEGSLMCIINY